MLHFLNQLIVYTIRKLAFSKLTKITPLTCSLLSIQGMSRRDLSVKGGTSERCYRTRRGWTDELRYAIISPYFDGRIKMNGPYPEITNISSLAKLFFKTFISLKHLSDYRTVGLSDCRIIATAPVSSSSGVPCCVIVGWFKGNQLMVDLVAHYKGLFPSSLLEGFPLKAV
jgi:hypothetical protein